MAYYHPCKNCAIDTTECPRRAEVAKAIAGISVTSVKFLCGDRLPLYSPGQRVAFNWTLWDNVEDESYPIALVYHGTVIQEKGLRFIVRVDDAPSADEEQIKARDLFKSDNLVIKVKPSDMRALPEPDRPMCSACSAYEGEEGRCLGWGLPGDKFDSYYPIGCRVEEAKLNAAKVVADAECAF